MACIISERQPDVAGLVRLLQAQLSTLHSQSLDAGSAAACAASCVSVLAVAGRGRGSDHHRWPNAYFAEHGLYLPGSRPMQRRVNPLEGKTINRRAGCGRSARPVRREGGPNSIGSPYPYLEIPMPQSFVNKPPLQGGGCFYRSPRPPAAKRRLRPGLLERPLQGRNPNPSPFGLFGEKTRSLVPLGQAGRGRDCYTNCGHYEPCLKRQLFWVINFLRFLCSNRCGWQGRDFRALHPGLRVADVQSAGVSDCRRTAELLSVYP